VKKRWLDPDPVPQDAARELEAFAPHERSVLWRRGIATRLQAAVFLRGGVPQHDPFGLLGMQTAAGRLGAAVAAGEPIVIYGDYDADGLTGTAVLVSALRARGARVSHFIPSRYAGGYGLTIDALQALAQGGARLVVTADCGARSVAEAEAAHRLGLDLIITDHHAPGDQLPRCLATINPRQPGDGYPFKDLSGAGIAYKVAQALAQSLGGPDPDDLLDLVAVGTIADLVPLLGENRGLTQAGLERLRRSPRPGLHALMQVSGIQPSGLRASGVGFGIAPRLNAAGRLASPEAAYELLMAQEARPASELAGSLDRANRDRRLATTQLVELARSLGREDPDAHLIFAAHADFREGLAGLVAARLVEEFHRPVVIAHLGESEVRGSARSIPEFHITRALDECADLLIRHGGHAAAAGFTVSREQIGLLGDRLQAIARRELSGADLTPAIQLDAWLSPGDITLRSVDFAEALEPCGCGNEAPLYAAHGLRVRSARTVGAEGRHLKLVLGSDGSSAAWDAIGFGMGPLAQDLPARLEAAFRLERNTWGGYESLQLNLVDLRPGPPGAG
jgi:single-stranded-DNA-specific exonuclease